MSEAEVKLPNPDRARYASLGVLEWRRRKRRIPFVQQTQMADCGAACLTMVLGFHDRAMRLEEVRQALGIGRDGSTMGGIARTAKTFGLRARALKLDVEGLKFLPRPSILHWNLNHFVVFDRVDKKGVRIVDPGMGPRCVDWAVVNKSFTGVALSLEPTDDFQRLRAGKSRTWAYLRALLGEGNGIARIVAMSLVLRTLGMALPLLTALIVDRVVPRSDMALLIGLGVSLALILLFKVLSELTRSHLLLELRTRLDVKLTLGFLEHLVRLPLSFFQTRPSGDLLMRVNSNAQMRQLLTSGALSALLDGFFVLLYLGLIVALSVPLGLLVLALSTVQVTLFVLTRARYREFVAQELESQAQSNSYLVQLIAGIQTLKTAGVEDDAVVHWSNLFSRSLNQSLSRGRLQALVDALLGAVRTGAPFVVLTFGAVLAIRGDLSLGVMLALNALAMGFLEPVGQLVDQAVALQGVVGHIERLDDVLGQQREQDDTRVLPAPRMSGHVRLDRVSFRYSPTAAFIVKNASIEVLPGMSVALVGKSGSGKSTMASLLLGLYRPEEGRIEFDGRDLASLDVRSVRRQMGIVPQSPFIFSGSVRDNIALNDPDAPMHKVIRAARMACIHADIKKMPMQYETPISEGGGSLSGGQRQRIAMARALMHEPAILLLDEATSALDASTEADITRNLASLHCTKLVIAHRLSTIMNADLIVVVDEGTIVEMGSHTDLMAQMGRYHNLVSAQTREEAKPERPRAIADVASTQRRPQMLDHGGSRA